MDVYYSIDHYVVFDFVILYLLIKGCFQRINGVGKLLSNLVQSFLRPLSKPIYHATVEEGWGGGCSIRKVRVIGVHGENHVQVSLYVLDEVPVKLIVSINHFIALRLFELIYQRRVLLTFEETRNLS